MKIRMVASSVLFVSFLIPIGTMSAASLTFVINVMAIL